MERAGFSGKSSRKHKYYDPECEDGEPFATLLSMIELLPDRKRHDLMCLMYLGRNLAYYGLNEEVVDDFCAYADEKPIYIIPPYRR